MRAFLEPAADLVLPRACGGCGVPGTALCSGCATLLTGAPRLVVPRPVPRDWPTCWAGAAYEGPTATVLREYKDGDRRDLAPWLASCLSVAIDAALAAEPGAARAAAEGRLVVIPVPSARRASRRRGDRPVVALARIALVGLRAQEARLVEGLTLARSVADQAGLGARARRDNLEAAMLVRPADRRRVRGSVCLVVDDVVTSGSTVAEAARALRVEGAAGVLAAAALATPRRDAVANPLPAGSHRD